MVNLKSVVLALTLAAAATTALASESPVNLIEAGVDRTHATESFKAAHEFDTPYQNAWNQN